MKGRRLFLILAISIAAFPSPPISPWSYIGDDSISTPPKLDKRTPSICKTSDGDTGKGKVSHQCVNSNMVDIETKESEALFGHVIWLFDPSSNLCLGVGGFSQCGDTNLFRVTSASSSGKMQLELIEPFSNARLCLSASRWSTAVSVSECSRSVFSTTKWEYSVVEGRLASAGIRQRCLSKEGNNALVHSCHSGFTELRPIFHTQKPKSTDLTLAPLSTATSSLKCPHTGLTLPARLSDVTHDPDLSRQTLAGMGVYTKQAFGMLFRVFTIGWYLDRDRVARDATLAPFKLATAEERLSSSEYFDALASPTAAYDRSVLVKLAMGVKRDLLIEGLVQELNLRPESSRLVAEAGHLFKSPNCERGLGTHYSTVDQDYLSLTILPCAELLFTWRAASGERRESLDIRVNGRPIASIGAAGVAPDFFSKFVMRDPVSPELKERLSEGLFYEGDTSSATAIMGEEGEEDEERVLPAPALLPSLSASPQCESVNSVYKCLRRLRLRRQALLDEMYASFFVLFYCVLLITQSLPSKTKEVFRVVRLRHKLSSFKSSLKLSAENFAKKCSMRSALNLLASDAI